MEYKQILVEKGDKVGKIILNTPPLNLITIVMALEVEAAVRKLTEDPEVRVIILTSAPGSKFFSAGASIEDHFDPPGVLVASYNKLTRTLIDCPKPTVAAVNGTCWAGGFEVVMCCDMMVAAEEASFSMPEIKLGGTCGPGLALLPRMMGRAKALEFLLSADTITAREAEQIGFINKVVPLKELDKVVTEFVAKFTDKSGIALQYNKQGVNSGLELELRKAIEIADLVADVAMKSEDATEGTKAFFEKRQPVWKT
jgi:enoyl-CoA hydratase/carnithine racemase